MTARSMALRVAASVAAVLALASLASAEDARPNAKLAEVLPPVVGNKACFARVYDAKHLAAHPKQRVTSMTVFLRMVGIDMNTGGDWVLDPAARYDRKDYQIAFSVRRREDKKPLTANAFCPEGPSIRCNRECDGGGVTLEKSGDGLMLRLDRDGVLIGACNEDKGVWLKEGADDKAFRLDKVADAVCAGLEKEGLGE